MKLNEIFNAKAIAANWTEAASNKVNYLGKGFFPAAKKAGLDLKWIKGSKGLPVSLAPSNFDSKSTFRDRIGISVSETEMPFFRESMLVSERDEQEIMRVQDSADPYAQNVLNNIYNDSQTLIDGANVVPERMIMQLLAPSGGNVEISISANGTAYSYDYDPNGTWAANHYLSITTADDQWDAPATCKPLEDLETALDSQETASGNRPRYALMSKGTFNKLKAAASVKSAVLAQNPTANIFYTDKLVKQLVEESLGLTILVYNKKFKNESGVETSFYPDKLVMLLPEGELGKTWYGTTPEERTLAASGQADVSVVETGVAVAVSVTNDPVNTKTTVSEIVLPSFERMDECYCLEVWD